MSDEFGASDWIVFTKAGRGIWKLTGGGGGGGGLIGWENEEERREAGPARKATTKAEHLIFFNQVDITQIMILT